MAFGEITRHGWAYVNDGWWVFDLADGEWLELVRQAGKAAPGWHVTRMPGMRNPRNEWVGDTLAESIDTCEGRGWT